MSLRESLPARPRTFAKGLLLTALVAPLAAQGLREEELPRVRHFTARAELAPQVTIAILRDGTLQLDGKAVTYAGFRTALRRHVLARPVKKAPRRTDRSSSPAVLVFGHRDLPALAIRKVLEALIDNRVNLRNAHLAVRGNGAVPVWLDVWPGIHYEIEVSHARGRVATAKLQDRLKESSRKHSEPVIVHCGADVSFREAMATADRISDAKFNGFRLRCTPTKKQTAAWRADQDLRQLVASYEPPQTPPTLRFVVRESGFESRKISVGLGGTPGLPEELRMPKNDLGRLPVPALIAIAEGLKWLAANQNDDGSWSPIATAPRTPGRKLSRIGGTSLALLAMLLDGNSMRSGQYKGHVQSAVKFLRGKIAREGQPGNAGFAAAVSEFERAMATVAYIECYRRSSYRLLIKDVRQLVADLIARPVGDAATRSLRLHALLAARSLRIEVTDEAIAKARDASLPAEPDLTAVGGSLFCDAVSGRAIAEGDPRLVPVAAVPFTDDRKTPTAMDWFFATRGLRRTNGKAWRRWRPVLVTTVPDMQIRSPDLGGCWQELGPDNQRIDSPTATAFFCLALLSDSRPRR
ncbi:MAG: hypothetical protein NXI31_14785 [bacterium]|nr:hypothetical protein [bacterium]